MKVSMLARQTNVFNNCVEMCMDKHMFGFSILKKCFDLYGYRRVKTHHLICQN